eukprot:m.339109 g.339109  ORF g.339109 m.339109 type:complete len:396 (-) comp18672_c0_seq1:84-1271(-)
MPRFPTATLTRLATAWRAGNSAVASTATIATKRTDIRNFSTQGSLRTNKLLSSSPVQDAEEISHIAFGFMASKSLFAALDIELFKALSGGKNITVTDLQEKHLTNVKLEKLETLCTSLCSVGLLTRDAEGKLSNPPAVESFLAKTKPSHDFGDYLRFQIDKQMYPFMQHLSQRMSGDASEMRYRNYEEWMGNEDEARLYTESQHSGSIGPAKTLAREYGDLLNECKTVLDVGGGSGGFSITLAEKIPHLNISILDFPNVCTVGEEFVKRSTVGDRVKFLPGNALETEFPDNNCAVLMSYLSSSVSGEALAPLYKKAYDVTRPGGYIFLHDFILEDSRDGPPLTALWALQHMVFTPGAVSLTPSYLSEQLVTAGWKVKTVSEVIPGMTKLVIGVKE